VISTYKVYKDGKLMATYPTLTSEIIKSMQSGGYVVKKDGKSVRKGG
jgi:hypothetical protein